MKRGEIRWYTFALPDKRRPVLILTRDDVIDHINEIIVVPITRTQFRSYCPSPSANVLAASSVVCLTSDGVKCAAQ